jgi:hypothetical protein
MTLDRKCNCNFEHGPLYICPTYSEETKRHIAGLKASWVSSLSDPTWAKKQLDKGIDPMVIGIFRAFSDIEKVQ